jgi:hypothetical protein
VKETVYIVFNMYVYVYVKHVEGRVQGKVLDPNNLDFLIILSSVFSHLCCEGYISICVYVYHISIYIFHIFYTQSYKVPVNILSL